MREVARNRALWVHALARVVAQAPADLEFPPLPSVDALSAVLGMGLVEAEAMCEALRAGELAQAVALIAEAALGEVAAEALAEDSLVVSRVAGAPDAGPVGSRSWLEGPRPSTQGSRRAAPRLVRRGRRCRRR